MKAALLFGSFLVLTACAESRYRSNLQHAPLTRWTHLSRSDYEQVVRIVSYSPISLSWAITTDHAKSDSTHLHVITGYSDSEIQRWHGIHLEKRAAGWHITFKGEVSPMMAEWLLSGTF